MYINVKSWCNKNYKSNKCLQICIVSNNNKKSLKKKLISVEKISVAGYKSLCIFTGNKVILGSPKETNTQNDRFLEVLIFYLFIYDICSSRFVNKNNCNNV